MTDIFGALGANDTYASAFAHALERVWRDGTRATLARYLDDGRLTMFLGIDLGTSSVKAVLIDDVGTLVARVRRAALRVAPAAALVGAGSGRVVAGQRRCGRRPRRAARVQGFAPSGCRGRCTARCCWMPRIATIRPAILWNDGRSAAACRELERREPRTRAITGNLAMPGFTAPKLIWVAEHEPQNFAPRRARAAAQGLAAAPPDRRARQRAVRRRRHVVARRRRGGAGRTRCSPRASMDERQMPRLVEGTDVSGRLTPTPRRRSDLPVGTPVAGGGGDNACGAVGIGVVRPGDAFLSLGTSGVIFVADGHVRPIPIAACMRSATACRACGTGWR